MKITGLVVSDLHLLSMRSSGEERLEDIRAELSAARVIVLNGDTFDFRWNALASQGEAVRAAISWLEGFLSKHPDAEIHFVLGNHDCLEAFVSQLEKFAAEHPGSIGIRFSLGWERTCSCTEIVPTGRWMRRAWPPTAAIGRITSRCHGSSGEVTGSWTG